MRVTGLALRTVWRRMENPAWKRNVDKPLNRALIAVEALRADLLFPAADEDLPVPPAADQRDPEAMNDLALLLLEAGQAEAAQSWLRRAATAGHADAMHWIGRCLISGEGTASIRSAASTGSGAAPMRGTRYRVEWYPSSSARR